MPIYICIYPPTTRFEGNLRVCLPNLQVNPPVSLRILLDSRRNNHPNNQVMFQHDSLHCNQAHSRHGILLNNLRDNQHNNLPLSRHDSHRCSHPFNPSHFRRVSHPSSRLRILPTPLDSRYAKHSHPLLLLFFSFFFLFYFFLFVVVVVVVVVSSSLTHPFVNTNPLVQTAHPTSQPTSKPTIYTHAPSFSPSRAGATNPPTGQPTTNPSSQPTITMDTQVALIMQKTMNKLLANPLQQVSSHILY